MCTIILNGKTQKTEHNNVEDLILGLELPNLFVVEHNGDVVYKENYKTKKLEDGDIIEIASFCGGG